MAHPAVARLTLEEKAGLLSGASFWRTRAVEAADVEAAVLTDGPHGVRLQTGAGDHLGLHDSEPATAFPTASATGSTWDPDLLREVGEALGREARALGVDVLLGPGINIKRSPLCGRNFEYLSEDPLLAGVLGAAWVEGLQSEGVGASVKHYAANNQETDRMRVSAQVDERTLREIYLPAFERVVTTASPATVMCSYNKVNGTYAAQHPWLLTEVLRDEWGFDGYVVSDWGAVTDPVASVAAGLDLEMPGTGDRSPGLLIDAVRRGELDETVLDRAVSRVLGVHDRLRAARATDPAGTEDVDPGADAGAHHDLARRVAAASMVLLVNDGDLLPLDARDGGRIAVVGELARTPRYQGAGSSKISPTRLDDALTAIRAATDREVGFAAGYTLDAEDEADPTEQARLRDEAVALADGADVVVLVLGLPAAEESEGFDRTHLLLPAAQRDLVAAVTGVTPRVVVVLAHGGVVTLDGITGVVPAVLETWLSGQAGGSATADVLFGVAEPGGRLAETVPLALAHTPAHVNWPGADGVVTYGERLYVGYRWYDATDREVDFPFGHGLGYTTYAYDDLRVDVPDPSIARARVEVVVENTGARAGAEVVQVYVGHPGAAVDRPVRELRAFAKVHLEPGERRTVALDLDERAFAHWSPDGWRVEPGTYVVDVGASSRDLRATAEVVLEVPAPVPALTTTSTLDEWRAHPAGGPVLAEALAGQAGAGTLEDPETLALVGPMPLRAVLSFASSGDGPDPDEVLAGLLAQARDRAPAPGSGATA